MQYHCKCADSYQCTRRNHDHVGVVDVEFYDCTVGVLFPTRLEMIALRDFLIDSDIDSALCYVHPAKLQSLSKCHIFDTDWYNAINDRNISLLSHTEFNRYLEGSPKGLIPLNYLQLRVDQTLLFVEPGTRTKLGSLKQDFETSFCDLGQRD